MSRFAVVASRSSFRSFLLLLIVLAAIAGWQMWNTAPLDQNNPDGGNYLAAAWNLVQRQAYSNLSPDAAPEPYVFREPGYSAFVAVAMLAGRTQTSRTIACLFGHPLSCADELRPYQNLNIALYGLAAILLYFAATAIAGTPLAGWVAALAIMLNKSAISSRFYVVSDYLALALLAAAILAAVWAVRRRSRAGWFGCGLALAALTLTKAVYLYFVAAMLPLAVLWLLTTRRLDRMATICLLAFIVGYASPVAGWMARNYVTIGEWVITKGRGSLLLAHRDYLNDMSGREYATAFLWWTRGLGNGMARRNLDRTDYGRFELENPDGWQEGGNRRYSDMIARMMAERGLDEDRAESAAREAFIGRILARLPKHFAVTLPVFYRGIYVDEFIVLSLPALVFLIVTAVRRREDDVLAALSPAVFSLLFHALFTPNDPRFQVPAVASLALALGLAAFLAHRRWRARRKLAPS